MTFKSKWKELHKPRYQYTRNDWRWWLRSGGKIFVLEEDWRLK